MTAATVVWVGSLEAAKEIAQQIGFGVLAFGQGENGPEVRVTPGLGFDPIFRALHTLGYKVRSNYSTQDWVRLTERRNEYAEVSGHGCGCASHAE